MTEATGIFSNSSNVDKITLIPRQSRYIISIKIIDQYLSRTQMYKPQQNIIKLNLTICKKNYIPHVSGIYPKYERLV